MLISLQPILSWVLSFPLSHIHIQYWSLSMENITSRNQLQGNKSLSRRFTSHVLSCSSLFHFCVLHTHDVTISALPPGRSGCYIYVSCAKFTLTTSLYGKLSYHQTSQTPGHPVVVITEWIFKHRCTQSLPKSTMLQCRDTKSLLETSRG